jgi:DNA segregation ATPase FtsK/SpoIIIE-like protein
MMSVEHPFYTKGKVRLAMGATVLEKESLDLQADQIERALLGLSLPVRVNGGEVGRGWVRYHLTPVAGTPSGRVSEAAGAVADAIGVAEVRVAHVENGLAIDVPVPSQRDLRLLPLLQALGSIPALAAVIGLDDQGQPLLLRLDHRDTRHLLASGEEGSGKSELLRTLALSLALTTSPSRLSLLGIDIGGRELAVLEALPHLARGLATEPGDALRTLTWLAAEAERRQRDRLAAPHLVLVIDDLQWLTQAPWREALGLLRDLRRRGSDAAIHVLAAASPEAQAALGRGWQAAGLVEAESIARPAAGRFRFRCGGEAVRARVARLSAWDLDRAVALAQKAWSESRDAQTTSREGALRRGPLQPATCGGESGGASHGDP